MSDEELRVFVDHTAGARRGARQVLAAGPRLRFGRHPDCEIAFDPHRDLDASSRHAELRPSERGWVLVDLGSSNGTFVGGQRITEVAIAREEPVEVEFGAGGPRLRLFVGSDQAAATLPAAPVARRVRAWHLAVAVVVVAAVVVGLAVR